MSVYSCNDEHVHTQCQMLLCYILYLTIVTHLNYFYRELAFQLSEQFLLFGKRIGIRTAVVVGGVGECILLQCSTPGDWTLHFFVNYHFLRHTTCYAHPKQIKMVLNEW